MPKEKYDPYLILLSKNLVYYGRNSLGKNVGKMYFVYTTEFVCTIDGLQLVRESIELKMKFSKRSSKKT